MKLIILDRDGVINEDSDDFIKSTEEFIPIEGSLEAIARLNQSGYSVVIATNQSGIARKMFAMAAMKTIKANTTPGSRSTTAQGVCYAYRALH